MPCLYVCNRRRTGPRSRVSTDGGGRGEATQLTLRCRLGVDRDASRAVEAALAASPTAPPAAAAAVSRADTVANADVELSRPEQALLQLLHKHQELSSSSSAGERIDGGGDCNTEQPDGWELALAQFRELDVDGSGCVQLIVGDQLPCCAATHVVRNNDSRLMSFRMQ